jgi:hypothetical protein
MAYRRDTKMGRNAGWDRKSGLGKVEIYSLGPSSEVAIGVFPPTNTIGWSADPKPECWLVAQFYSMISTAGDAFLANLEF